MIFHIFYKKGVTNSRKCSRMASMREFPIREWNGGSCRMQDKLKKLIGDNINFVFVGEAGSGKSEISINFAKLAAGAALIAWI